MSQAQYNKLALPEIKQTCKLNVKNASGGDLQPLGFATCNFEMGQRKYTHDFIVCKGLRRSMILGFDFLRKHRIGTGWTNTGKFKLHDEKEIIVESIETCMKGPQIYLPTSLTIPARTLAVLNVKIDLQEEHEGKIYEVKPNLLLEEEFPELVMVPTIHKVNTRFISVLPYTLVNLDTEAVFLEKKQILGSLEPTEIELQGIITETATEIFNIEDKEYQSDDSMRNIERDTQIPDKKFITSPADVEIHRKVELQDAKVTEENKGRFKNLCKQFDDIFSKNSADIGKTPLITMEIETGDNHPITQRPYNLPLKHVEWVQMELDTLEKAGVIKRSVSPWASPIVIVPKKSEPGEPPRRRLCVDYRVINSLLPPVTKAHSKAKGVLTLVPLPKIDEIYAKLKGSKIYSTFDMRSGYYHMALSKESQPKSAFVTGGPTGAKYEFKVCPFGLAQAPAYFQRLVNEVLRGLPFAFGYLDDILIFSPDIETHLEHIEILFQRLREAQLKLKESKCNFLKAHVQYLGHFISGEGIEPLPEKLESVKEMPAPKNPKQVKQFLGLVGYYRKFVPRFADIARPLTNLTKQDQVYEWTEKCQDTFQLLKDMLLKEPILKYPDPNKPYILYTDASKYAWACVLTQEYEHEIEGKMKKIHHPITYTSGLFRGSQLNWATLTKEAYAIYMSIKKLTYYLEDSDITLRSDHLPLKKFLAKNTLNTKVNNWAVEISPFRIAFEYIKGIKNTLADTMSRLIKITPEIESEPEPEGYEFGYHVFEELEPIQNKSKIDKNHIIGDINSQQDPIPEDTQINWQITPEQLQKLQSTDKFCKNIINNLKAHKLPDGKPYYLQNNILKKYVIDNKQRFETIVVTPNCVTMLLNLAHDQLGHNGTARTYMLLKRMYYWKGMKPQIVRYVRQCKQCQRYNAHPVKYTKKHFDASDSPMEFISMDLIGEFHPPSSKGHKYALTVICMLTGFTFCVPLKSKHASEVVKAYVDQIYSKFGGSTKILSDNGTEFKNELFTKVANELGVEHKMYTAPYRPQSNGRIEGFHHFLKACISKHISQQIEWDDVIPLACAAYNFLPNEHSKESPFFLMFGREARLPLNTMFKPTIRYMGNDENILSLEALKKIYHMVAHNLKIAREKKDPKTIHRPHTLKTEDSVLIKSHVKPQFGPAYKGNYRIISFKGNQVEVMPSEGGKSQYVHITDVKYILPADNIIKHLPNFNTFGRKTNLNLNPDKIPDLDWILATNLNTKITNSVSYTTTHLTTATNTTPVLTPTKTTIINPIVMSTNNNMLVSLITFK